MSSPSSPQSDGSPLIGFLNTLALGLAAFLTAWSVYQSTLWAGKQMFVLAEAGAADRNAMRYELESRQSTLMDMITFTEFVEAKLEGNQAAADFEVRSFRPEMKQAFDAWIKLDPFVQANAPPSPFEMPEYVQLDALRAASFQRISTDSLANAQRYNAIADNYMLTTVVLSLVLFFGALCGRSRIVAIQKLLFGFVCICSVTAVIILTQIPITFQADSRSFIP